MAVVSVFGAVVSLAGEQAINPVKAMASGASRHGVDFIRVSQAC